MFKKTLILATLMLSASGAIAAPVAIVAANAVGYDSIQSAVETAVKTSYTLPNSDYSEYGGVIVQRGTMFYFSYPVTEKNLDEVHYVYHRIVGETLVSLYHTHPNHFQKDPHYSLFSEGDIGLADKVGVPSYIGVKKDQYETCHLTIRVYTTGDIHILERTPYGKHVYASGHLVSML